MALIWIQGDEQSFRCDQEEEEEEGGTCSRCTDGRRSPGGPLSGTPAALAVAIMEELKSYMPGKAANLKIETMVNLRRHIAREIPEYEQALSLFSAPIDCVVTVKKDQDFWACARAFKVSRILGGVIVVEYWTKKWWCWWW